MIRDRNNIKCKNGHTLIFRGAFVNILRDRMVCNACMIATACERPAK